MIALVLLAGGAFIFIAALVAFFLWRSNTNGKAAAPGAGDSLKDEIPSVLAVVKGEKAADVIASGYFTNMYPGVQVVTSRASIPLSAPAFLLLTNSAGTITGVEANSVLWDSSASAGPVAPTIKPKPTTRAK